MFLKSLCCFWLACLFTVPPTATRQTLNTHMPEISNILKQYFHPFTNLTKALMKACVTFVPDYVVIIPGITVFLYLILHVLIYIFYIHLILESQPPVKPIVSRNSIQALYCFTSACIPGSINIWISQLRGI